MHFLLCVYVCVSNFYCMVLIATGIEMPVQLNLQNTVVGMRVLWDSGNETKYLRSLDNISD